MNSREKYLILTLFGRLTELGVNDDQVQDLVTKLTPDAPQKPKGLKPRSDKREEQYKKYRPKRLAFLKKYPVCQVEQCRNSSCDIHHTAKRNGKRLTDERYWMAVCRGCHDHIGANPAWAYEKGYLIEVIRAG